jgi:hypothetical protein
MLQDRFWDNEENLPTIVKYLKYLKKKKKKIVKKNFIY